MNVLNIWYNFLSKRKSEKRKKAFNSGFNWVMVSYFLDNMDLESIDSYVSLDSPFDYNDMSQAFDTGANEALRIIWLDTGFSTGTYQQNMR